MPQSDVVNGCEFRYEWIVLWEHDIMKTHTLIGATMLENLKMYQGEILLEVAYQICRWHHERYDGKGYPDGLKGEE